MKRHTLHRITGSAAAILVAHVMVNAQGTAPAATQAAEGIGSMSVNVALIGLAVFQVIVIMSMSSIMRTLGSPGKFWTEARKRTGMMVLLTSIAVHANAMPANGEHFTTTTLFWWLVVTNVFLAVVMVVQMNLLRFLTKTILNKPEPVVVFDPTVEPWEDRVWRKLTNRVPVERETDILLDHNYDGIRELDNVLPPWWLWLFYGTILWSIVFMANHYVFNIWPDQDVEYKQEMAKAKADVAAYQAQFKNLVNEENVTLLTDAGSIAAGNREFQEYCVACHGTGLEGKEGLGPNLTDAYWKHGGGIKNVFRTIAYGVPEKGMISWKTQLKPIEMQHLASYILSLQGSNPPNAKAPEGDLWKEEGASADTTAVKSDSTKLAAIAP